MTQNSNINDPLETSWWFGIDQHQKQYVVITQGDLTGIEFTTDLIDKRQSTFHHLAMGGITLMPPQRREIIGPIMEGNVEARPFFLAESPGWIDDTTFILGDGTIICPAAQTDRPVLPGFALQPKFGVRGTLESWREAFVPLLDAQHLLTSLVCLGFTAPLLQPFGTLIGLEENPGLELVGPSSVGKTTAMRVISSIWGGLPGRSGAFAETWQMTEVAIGTLMRMHSDSVLILDEAAHAGVRVNDRNATQSRAVMSLAAGAGRHRHQQPASGRDWLTIFSTSNSPLASPGARSDRLNLAVNVRLVSVDLLGLPHGILDTTEGGAAGDLIRGLNTAAAENYGTAGRTFIQQLVEERARDPRAIQSDIIAHVETFQRAVKFTELRAAEQRIGLFFALGYAAACLARRWDILPSHWQRLGYGLRDTFHLALKSLPLNECVRPVDQFESQVAQLRDRFIEEGAIWANLEDPIGAIRRTRDHGLELQIPPKAFDQHFGGIPGLKDELRRVGALVTDGGKGLHLTAKRISLDGKATSRSVCVKLDLEAYPDRLQVLATAELAA